jgi:hypothetical protein
MQHNVVKYRILTQHSLILENYSGLIKLPDVEKILTREFQDPDFNPAFDYLCVLKNAKIVLTSEDLNKMSGFLDAVKDDVVPHKVALLTETPGQVASSTIYSELLRGMPVEIEVFTTFEAAVRWLHKSSKILSLIHEFLSNK